MTVENIMYRNRRKIVLDGFEFIVRKQDFGLLVRALGAGVIALVDSAEAGDDPDPAKRGAKMVKGQEVMEKVCREAMVNPALADETDPDKETITWADLGDLGPRLYHAIMQGVDDEVGNSLEPSEDRRA